MGPSEGRPEPIRCDVFGVGGNNEAAGFHHASRRRDGCMAACRAFTATRTDAADGVLMNTTADDPQGQARIAAFHQGLQQLGWVEGRNVRTEYRWGAGHANLYRKDASELVALAPDVLLAAGGTIAGALQQVTRTVPIVFVETSDPVSRGLVASMARPGGNTTGFVLYEFSMSGKWQSCSSRLRQTCREWQSFAIQCSFLGLENWLIQTAAASSAVELTPIDARDANNMESAITAFARGSNSGMIITSSGASFRNQKLIVALATRLRLPAIYDGRFFVTDGGLISYGPERADQFRRAASYVDRILKGEKPADLPVQAPTKFGWSSI